MHKEKYAVLEWQNGTQDEAYVIGEDLDIESVHTMITISPPHLYREFITMSKLESIRNKDMNLNKEVKQ